jgi:hypothetical protein
MSEDTMNGAAADPNYGDESLQGFFIQRLHRLGALESTLKPGEEQQTRRLIRHAIYSTYWDCAQVGLRPVAQAFVEKHRAQLAESSAAIPADLA